MDAFRFVATGLLAFAVAAAAPASAAELGEEDLRSWTLVLRSGPPTARAGAARILAAFPEPEIVPHLLAALDDPHLQVRIEAARGLLRAGERDAPPRLLRLLVLDRGAARFRIAGETGPLVQTSSGHEGALLAALLLARRGPRALDEVEPLLDESDPTVLWSVALTAGRIGPRARALGPRLRPLLEHESADVRWAAAWAAGKIGADERTADQLLPLLRDRDLEVARAALRGLVAAGPPAVPLLSQVARDSAHPLRGGAVRALAELGTTAEPALPVLLALAADRDEEHGFRALALRAAVSTARRRPRSVGEHLATHLADPAPSVRLAAARSFARLPPSVAAALTPAVRRRLGAKDVEIRLAALEALRAMGPAAAEAVLDVAALLVAEDARLRTEALVTLTKLGPVGREALGDVLTLHEQGLLPLQETAAYLGMLAVDSPSLALALSGRDAAARAARGAPSPALRAEAADHLFAHDLRSWVLQGRRPPPPDLVSMVSNLLRNADSEEEDARVQAFLDQFPPSWRSRFMAAAEQSGPPPPADVMPPAPEEPLDDERILLRELEQGSLQDRMDALTALAARGRRSEDTVVELASAVRHDPDPLVRLRACRLLHEIDASTARGVAVRVLEDLLEHDDPEIRILALQALGAMGHSAEMAVPAIAARLDDPLRRARREAALALARVSAEEAGPALLAKLERDDALEIEDTLDAFAVARNAVTPVLSDGLRARSWHVRARAARALGALGPWGREAKEGLLVALEDSDPDVRAEAAWALGAVAAGDEEIAAALDRCREAGEPAVAFTCRTVRLPAVEVDPAAVPR